MDKDDARLQLAKALHLTMAKLESDDPEWANLSDSQRHYYECCVDNLLERRELILSAWG